MTHTREIEIDLFIKGLYEGYGYDFIEYNRKHIERRILKFIESEHISSVSMLQHKMFHEPGYFDKMMPYFHVGCSTGEEVYSVALLLKEAGLLDKSHLYGTDFNLRVLSKAQNAVYSKSDYEDFVANYMKCGGEKSPKSYFQQRDGLYSLSSDLKEKVSFHHHNLTTNHILGEMTVVVCRNVLIYFSRPLQKKVFKLLDKSIKSGGILCLGAQETLGQSGIEHQYSKKFNGSKIYMKNYVRGY